MKLLLVDKDKRSKISSEEEIRLLREKGDYIKLVSKSENLKVYKIYTHKEKSNLNKKSKQVTNKIMYLSPTMDEHDIITAIKKINSMLTKANVKILVSARRKKRRIKFLNDISERYGRINEILLSNYGSKLQKLKGNIYLINKIS